VSWLTAGGSKQRRCCFKRRRERFFLFPSPPFPFLFFRFFQGFPLSSQFVFNFPLPFQAFPSSQFGFTNGSLLFGSFSLPGSFFFRLFPPLLLLRWVLFIEPSERGFLLLRMGSRSRGGWSASGRDWQGAAPSVLAGHAAGGRPVGVAPSVLARHTVRERRSKKKEEKKQKPFMSSPAARPGEEERGTVSFKTTPF
jgi:hypothetical protein